MRESSSLSPSHHPLLSTCVLGEDDWGRVRERITNRLFLIVYDRYQLMTDCWKEEPKARPSFYQMIEKLEIIMQKDAPYLDVNKHNEAHPYYNVPPHLE